MYIKEMWDISLIEVKHCHRFIDITQQKNGNATDTIAQEAK